MQVYFLCSLLTAVSYDRLELSLLLPPLHIRPHSCGWDSRQGLERKDTIQIPTTVWFRPEGRGVQPAPFLGVHAGHTLSKPGSLLCSLFYLREKRRRPLRPGPGVVHGCRHLGKYPSGDGHQSVDVD